MNVFQAFNIPLKSYFVAELTSLDPEDYQSKSEEIDFIKVITLSLLLYLPPRYPSLLTSILIFRVKNVFLQ